MSEVDLGRVRATSSASSHRARPRRRPDAREEEAAADTRYEAAEQAGQSGYWQVDLDEDGEEIERRFLVTRNVSHGHEINGGLRWPPS